MLVHLVKITFYVLALLALYTKVQSLLTCCLSFSLTVINSLTVKQFVEVMANWPYIPVSKSLTEGSQVRNQMGAEAVTEGVLLIGSFR